MAGLYDKQAKEYSESRPTYPASLFSMLASLTASHQLAWDVGAGNGQASVAVSSLEPLSSFHIRSPISCEIMNTLPS